MIEEIFLCGITGTPPHRDIHKTALGATETVAWRYFLTATEAIQQLKAMGYKVIAIEQAEKAVMLHEFIPETGEKYAVVFGNEVDGVAQDVVSSSDIVIEIPQFGMKHSLNISVSAGIVMWDMFLKLRNLPQ